MSKLFEDKGLPQDTGILGQRWQQDGSTPVNISESGGDADDTWYTVTTGKTLYIESITITTRDASGDVVVLDDGSGGTTRLQAQQQATAGVVQALVFSPPLKFETSVYYAPVGSPLIYANLTGWEE